MGAYSHASVDLSVISSNDGHRALARVIQTAQRRRSVSISSQRGSRGLAEALGVGRAPPSSQSARTVTV